MEWLYRKQQGFNCNAPTGPQPFKGDLKKEQVPGRWPGTCQSVEKPGLCVKHKPGFCRIEAKEG